MKKHAILLIINLVALASAFAQTAPVNSENVARVFLGNGRVAFYECNSGDLLVGQTSIYEYQSFRQQTDGPLVSLTLNGTPVPIDPKNPPKGLPYPKTGVRTQFNLNLDAYDDSGKYLGHGYFYADVLKKGDPTPVTLKAADVSETVNFPVPSGVNPSHLVLETPNGGSWSYNSFTGSFQFWYDPTVGTGYRILDGSTGVVYQIGDIPPFEETTVSTDTIVSVTYDGGVVEVPFSPTRSYVYKQSQQLDGNVKGVSAKVYMARIGKNPASVYISGLKGKIVVKMWVAKGELPIITTVETQSQPYGDYSYGGVSIQPGYDKVIIEVVGTLENPNGFEASFSCYSGGGK